MKLQHHIQNWLADRFTSVQYPNISPADSATKEASRTGLYFKYQIPFGKRLDLFIMSNALLLIGLVALFIIGLFIYLLF